MKFTQVLVALAFSAFSVGRASAALEVYTIAGTGTGSIGGQAFYNKPISFVMTGDTTNIAGEVLFPVTTSITIASVGEATFTGLNTLGRNVGPYGSNVFFGSDPITERDYFGFFTNQVFDLTKNFGPIYGAVTPSFDQFVDIGTSLGKLTFTDIEDVVFTGVQSAVPEPKTWVMLIAGFGMTGAAMRRRKVRASVTYV